MAQSAHNPAREKLMASKGGNETASSSFSPRSPRRAEKRLYRAFRRMKHS